MNLFTEEIQQKIEYHVLDAVQQGDCASALNAIPDVLDELYANIPDNRRISYGRVYTIKVLAKHLYTCLVEKKASIFPIALTLFEESAEFRTIGVALGILSFYGRDEDYTAVLPYFEKAAASEEWDVREFTQMFFRKLIKKYPEKAQIFLLRLVKSKGSG